MKILVRGGLHDALRLCQLWATTPYAWVFEQVAGCLAVRGPEPPEQANVESSCSCLSDVSLGPWACRHTLAAVSLFPQGEAFTAGRVVTCHLSQTHAMSFSLQYACGIKAEVVGKPSPEFFKSALQELGVQANQVGRPQDLCVWRPGALTRGSRGA